MFIPVVLFDDDPRDFPDGFAPCSGEAFINRKQIVSMADLDTQEIWHQGEIENAPCVQVNLADRTTLFIVGTCNDLLSRSPL